MFMGGMTGRSTREPLTAVTACTADEAESKAHPDRLEESCDANAMGQWAVCLVPAHTLSGRCGFATSLPLAVRRPSRLALSISPLLDTVQYCNDGGMTVWEKEGERRRWRWLAHPSPTAFGSGAFDQTQHT